MRRAKVLEKTLVLGTIKSKMGAGRQRTKCLNTVTNSIDVNLSKLGKTVKDRGAWCAAIHGVTGSDMTERPNNNRLMVGNQI